MQDKHLFEYAVIRVVPRVEREEFLNVGVILYCRKPAFLAAKAHVPAQKLLSLCATIELDEVAAHINALLQISAAAKDAGPIAALDAASRFRWLTAKRSSMLQTSPVHPGFCCDPAATLDKLFEQLVL